MLISGDIEARKSPRLKDNTGSQREMFDRVDCEASRARGKGASGGSEGSDAVKSKRKIPAPDGQRIRSGGQQCIFALSMATEHMQTWKNSLHISDRVSLVERRGST